MPQDTNKIPTGPIPGENYTSDTRNYPWHRPPEITDMDKAIEEVIKQLTTTKGAYGLLNTLQSGVTIVQAADMLVTSGIGKGKWTPDFAILLAGPVARMMEIMAKDADIKYDLGLDDLPTKTMTYYKEKAKITNETTSKAIYALESSKDTVRSPETPNAGAKGFMPRKESAPNEMETMDGQ